ncbi:response regulator transcription factor [Rhodopseudomonas telluris]|uniref:Response regulator transcription factor n=1 Tax=Rhodopseudomonas telluris TaxID=644215 RepID=A0ABV6EWV5_9BRAD
MSAETHASEQPLICVVDDDEDVRNSLSSLLRSAGYRVNVFAGPSEFLASDAGDAASCLILDIRLGEADGLEFQQELAANDAAVPIVLISGHGDIPMTVRGMKAGAVNFLPKPFEEAELIDAVEEAVARAQRRRSEAERENSVRVRYDTLSQREREVMGLVTAGLMNKQVAWKLSLSEITVKIHRGNMMRKMQARSLAELVRMADLLGVRAVHAAEPDGRPSGSAPPQS